MIVKIPNNNIEERKYIIDILLGEFLGLSFSIEIGEVNNYHIVFEDKELIVEDHFFNRYPEKLSYLRKEAIPSNVKFTTNKFIVEDNLPILFGEEKLNISENKILVSNDIFAASFFMLTRWEEIVIENRDKYNRFSVYKSLSWKFNFLHRPIVNEYLEMLWNMLKYLGYDGERTTWNYEFVPTHDVDYITYWGGFTQWTKVLFMNFFKSKDIKLFLDDLQDLIKTKLRLKKDPYNTFEWLMEISESIGVISRFYFMSSDKYDTDRRYKVESKLARRIIKKIINRGHIVGFHPSFNSFNEPLLWRAEKERLESIAGVSIKEGRQHYLRFDPATTWQIWSQNEMLRDLTLSYADKEGFRCGVCLEYSVFNILERSKLPLKEMPLVAMETTLIGYQNLESEVIFTKVTSLIDTVKKYNGSFVFLWHNSNFNTKRWIQYKEVYKKIVLYSIEVKKNS